ncbi:MAG: hypothetical protein HOV97_12630, partial [Nonomuraea sp.]|nr:hypothetical protein [Nonomuraea sp.]
MRNGRTFTTLALAALLVAGCSSGGGGGAQPSGGGPGQSQAPVAKLAITPADGTEKVAPDTGITVKATGGKVTTITVADAKGREVAGAVANDGTWRPKWPLRPATTYTVQAQARGTDGKVVTGKSGFTTLKPKRALQSGLS